MYMSFGPNTTAWRLEQQCNDSIRSDEVRHQQIDCALDTMDRNSCAKTKGTRNVNKVTLGKSPTTSLEEARISSYHQAGLLVHTSQRILGVASAKRRISRRQNIEKERC